MRLMLWFAAAAWLLAALPDGAAAALALSTAAFATVAACCCGSAGECELCSDRFAYMAEGADLSTATQCDWSVLSGSAAISDDNDEADMALQSTTAGTVLQSATEASTTSSILINSAFVLRSKGSDFRVLLDLVDEDNYLAAEYTVLTSTQAGAALARLRFVRRTAGVDAVLSENYTWTLDADYWYGYLTVCLNEAGGLSARATAQYSVDHTLRLSDITTVTSQAVGIALNVLAAPAEPTGCQQFSLKNEAATPECDTCPADCAVCTDAPPPNQIKITVTGSTNHGPGNCCNVNGDYYLDRGGHIDELGLPPAGLDGACTYTYLEQSPACACVERRFWYFRFAASASYAVVTDYRVLTLACGYNPADGDTPVDRWQFNFTNGTTFTCADYDETDDSSTIIGGHAYCWIEQGGSVGALQATAV